MTTIRTLDRNTLDSADLWQAEQDWLGWASEIYYDPDI